MSGQMIAVRPCWVHKGLFMFNPDLVTSVLIDPVTGLSPDLGGDPGRARREPVCPDCCRTLNPERVRRGLEPLDERDSVERAREEER